MDNALCASRLSRRPASEQARAPELRANGSPTEIRPRVTPSRSGFIEPCLGLEGIVSKPGGSGGEARGGGRVAQNETAIMAGNNRIMIFGPLAAAGYHAISPDQRGYGRTTELFARVTATKLTHVPYRGDALAEIT